MSYNLPADLEQLLQDRLASGHYASEAEVLREALLSLADREDDLEAVRSAIDAMEAGDQGISVKDAFDLVRSQNNLK
jgi:putative addiction module CopG family antidote